MFMVLIQPSLGHTYLQYIWYKFYSYCYLSRFHPQNGALVTGADDGIINVWNIEQRSKTFSFYELKQCELAPITSIDFNHDGSIMGYATNYNWNKGQKTDNNESQRSGIYLHCINMKQFAYPKIWSHWFNLTQCSRAVLVRAAT